MKRGHLTNEENWSTSLLLNARTHVRQDGAVSCIYRAVAHRRFDMGKVIGIDLGDRKSHYCVLNESGVVIEEGAVQSTPAAFSKHFATYESCLIAIEVCVHSRWANRVLRDCGHEVVVANTVRLHLIHKSSRKSESRRRLLAGAFSASRSTVARPRAASKRRGPERTCCDPSP